MVFVYNPEDGIPAVRQGKSPTSLLNKTPGVCFRKRWIFSKSWIPGDQQRSEKYPSIIYSVCRPKKRHWCTWFDSFLAEIKINSRFRCSTIVCFVNKVENHWHWFHRRWKKAMHLLWMTCQLFFFLNTLFVASTYSCQESRILAVRNPHSPTTHL